MECIKTLKKMGSRYGSRKVNKVRLKGGEKIKVLKCSIEILIDNNYKLIAGRRKYITKFFNFNSLVNNKEFEHIINNLQIPSLCIHIARIEDMFLKLSKQIICKIKSTNNCLFSQQIFEKLQKINNTLREKFKVNFKFLFRRISIENITILTRRAC